MTKELAYQRVFVPSGQGFYDGISINEGEKTIVFLSVSLDDFEITGRSYLEVLDISTTSLRRELETLGVIPNKPTDLNVDPQDVIS